MTFLIAACRDNQPAIYQQPPAVAQAPMYAAPSPVVVQPQSSGAGTAFLGAEAGAAVGNMLSRPAAAPAPNNTVIVKKYYNRPAYRPVFRSTYKGRK